MPCLYIMRNLSLADEVAVGLEGLTEEWIAIRSLNQRRKSLCTEWSPCPFP